MRAACAFALGAFVAAGGARSEHGNALNQQVGIALAARLAPDASALVRAEILAGTHRTAPQRTNAPPALADSRAYVCSSAVVGADIRAVLHRGPHPGAGAAQREVSWREAVHAAGPH